MYGLWVTNEGHCSHYYIEIKRSNKGTYAPYSGDVGCDGKKWTGKVTYNDNHLYIGHTKFTFTEKPMEYNGTDSISWPFPNGNYKILAKMSLRLGVLHHNDSYTFKKIIDY